MNRKHLDIAVIVAAVLIIFICGLLVYRKLDRSDLGRNDNAVTEVKSDAAKDEADREEENVKLTDEENRELLAVYKGMKERNPDFAGYLIIEGTKVAYPVMYTPDDSEKYLHKDINGVECDGGLPFIDSRCKVDPDSDNVIIYGHNMKDGSMFASLISYKDRKYFEEHPTIRFDTADEVREYEVMSVFADKVYYTDEDVYKFYNFTDAENEADFDDNVKQLNNRSVYDTGISAQYGDKLITLVTCSYHTDDGRFVVVAKRSK